MVMLAVLYPAHCFWYQLLIGLDIFSHWMHMYASLIGGSKSHKLIDLSSNPVLYIYYHNKLVLFTLCALNESFFCGMYLWYFGEGPEITVAGHTYGAWAWMVYVSFVPMAIKQVCRS